MASAPAQAILVRAMKGRDLEKLLASHGFAPLPHRQRGSHVTWSNGDIKVTVASHGGRAMIPVGTVSSILKAAGLIE